MLTEGSFLGHYRILRQIGSGGMGTIYQAEDTHMHRQVAVKVTSHCRPKWLTPMQGAGSSETLSFACCFRILPEASQIERFFPKLQDASWR